MGLEKRKNSGVGASLLDPRMTLPIVITRKMNRKCVTTTHELRKVWRSRGGERN